MHHAVGSVIVGRNNLRGDRSASDKDRAVCDSKAQAAALERRHTQSVGDLIGVVASIHDVELEHAVEFRLVSKLSGRAWACVWLDFWLVANV